MKLLSWLIKLQGVKSNCDNCGYSEKIKNLNILVETNNLDSLLNMRCPKCGHIMINEADIKSLKKILNLTDISKKESKFKFN